MKRSICLLLSVLLLFSFTACNNQNDNPNTNPTGGVIPGVSEENFPRMDGSTANLPLMANVYSKVCGVPLEEAENKVRISGGTGNVWRNMMYEGADLLLVYEAPETVKEDIAQMGIEFLIDPIGRDGLVFLVNAQNPVESLTIEQLIGIYTGEITDWSEVGGDPGPIAPFQRNAESGSQTLFLKLLMGDTQPMDPPTELVMAEMGGLVDAVAAYDGSGGAIGYSVYYYANAMYGNPDLKLISVEGVAPGFDTIQNGSYPLLNDFYVVIRPGEEDTPAGKIREWLFTDAGKEAFTELGYIPIP